MFVVLFSKAFASEGTNLTLTLFSSNVLVQIDNRSYPVSENVVMINNIQPGQHFIRIYKSKGYRNVSGTNKGQLVYSANIYVRPAYSVDVMVNRYGKALIDERPSSTVDDWANNQGYQNGGYNNNGYYGNQAMTDNEFTQLLQQVQKEWFSDGKMLVAKQALTSNYVTVAQVKQLIGTMTFDSDKLEMAKLAYKRTVDQRSYYQVMEALSSQSSKDELAEYMNNTH